LEEPAAKDLYPGTFSRHAAAYKQRLDEVMARSESRGRAAVIDWVNATPGQRILDLACGPGTLSYRLAREVSPDGEVVAIDLAPGMIELARREAPTGLPVRFELMDMEELRFPDAHFDAGVCGHGLQFAPHLVVALGEARRVLRTAALLAASVPIDATVDRVWSLVDEVVNRWLGPPPQAGDQQSTRDVVADPQQLGQAALDAGFASARVELIEDRVSWRSAEQFVSQLAGWWACASRMEGIDGDRRHGFMEEATDTIRRVYPGKFDTTGRNHVLVATA